MQTYVFTGSNQVQTLIVNHPDLLTIPAVQNFQQKHNTQFKPKKTCNCRMSVSNSIPQSESAQFLESLTQSDFEKIKQIAKFDKVCYYKKNTQTKALEIICH